MFSSACCTPVARLFFVLIPPITAELLTQDTTELIFNEKQYSHICDTCGAIVLFRVTQFKK